MPRRHQRGATCYVSPDYFAEQDPFADFIVHEAAHIFHNCERRTIGLRETRTREWLLDIQFRKRETFAYSCEAYARIIARAKSPAERRALAAEYGSERRLSEERVDPVEVASIVAEAANSRNGWKVILRRCAPSTKSRSINAGKAIALASQNPTIATWKQGMPEMAFSSRPNTLNSSSSAAPPPKTDQAVLRARQKPLENILASIRRRHCTQT